MSKHQLTTQSGFTLIELMIVIAVIGILASIAVVSYQTQVRQTQLITIYQEVNQFRLPYQILINEGAGVSGFSPSGLNIPAQTKYCQFSVTKPAASGITIDAITCTIQNLAYAQGQTLSLDRTADSAWQCRASTGIAKAYLPKDCQ
ncbi:pilin [Psychrobacter urativorans]|uniref:pilin n=1 Tax=Psychrobacter urativorans TaxID=45610 RepID=UPI001919B2BA|nr:pilin [Psychrobacter urativorans]